MHTDQQIEVIIADDNAFLAQALAENLNSTKLIRASKTFTRLEHLIEYIPNSSFHVLILDVNFNGANSLDFIDKIKAQRKNFKIIVLTTLNNSYIKQKALSKGVDAFKGKDTSYENFDQVIIDCFEMKKNKGKKSDPASFYIGGVRFTQTKINVIKALFEHSDKTEGEIANVLNISTSSLKSHKRQLYDMTNTNKAIDLMKFAFRNGILID